MYSIVKIQVQGELPLDIQQVISAEPFVEVTGSMIADSLPAWFDELVIVCHQARTIYFFDIFAATTFKGVVFKESYIYQTVNFLQSLLRLGVDFETSPRDPFILGDMAQLSFGLSSPINHVAMDLTNRNAVQEKYSLAPEGTDPLVLSALLTRFTYEALVEMLKSRMVTQTPKTLLIMTQNIQDQMDANFFLAYHAAHGFTVDESQLDRHVKAMEQSLSEAEASIADEMKQILWPESQDDDTKIPPNSLFAQRT